MGKTEDMIKKTEDLVLSDGRMKLTFVARETRVLELSIWKYLHEQKHVRKEGRFLFRRYSATPPTIYGTVPSGFISFLERK
jgi:hypothetical protein